MYLVQCKKESYTVSKRVHWTQVWKVTGGF